MSTVTDTSHTLLRRDPVAFARVALEIGREFGSIAFVDLWALDDQGVDLITYRTDPKLRADLERMHKARDLEANGFDPSEWEFMEPDGRASRPADSPYSPEPVACVRSGQAQVTVEMDVYSDGERRAWVEIEATGNRLTPEAAETVARQLLKAAEAAEAVELQAVLETVPAGKGMRRAAPREQRPVREIHRDEAEIRTAAEIREAL